MSRWYTLAEIARMTGIPLADLEAYARDFPDLLPKPQCGVRLGAPAASPPATGEAERPAVLRRGWWLAALREAYRRWLALLRRLATWGWIGRAARALRGWWRSLEPA